MKDHDTLETHNIKDGMTVHLVIRSGNAGANNQQQQSPRPNPEANPSNTPFGLGGVGGVPGMSNLGLGSGQFISTYLFSNLLKICKFFEAIVFHQVIVGQENFITSRLKKINQFPGIFWNLFDYKSVLLGWNLFKIFLP